MDDLLDDHVDLFIAVPLDQVDKQAIFMRLFINIVLGTVVRQDGWRKVKVPILLVLDEFVRMGRMEQIINIANVAAGADVKALFVTQDMGQTMPARSLAPASPSASSTSTTSKPPNALRATSVKALSILSKLERAKPAMKLGVFPI